jgi:NAD(P)-dependent dehydrogenase (short-subunit alcohol dehydrogenase family)
MSQKTAVVTGASSGFGLLISLELARLGFRVIGTMRNLEKKDLLLKEAAALGCQEFIQIEELDVASEVSVYQFKRKLEQIGRVDVLVNNAGFAGVGFVEEIPISEYRKQFETNVFGLIMVTQVCLPFMRMQRSGKIINISSISGIVGFPGLSPYTASKHAVEGFSESLRLEVKPYGIDVSLVEPGSYKTNIWTTGKQVAERSLSEDSPYYSYMNKIEAYIKKGESQYGDPTDVAKKVAEIALDPRPNLRYPIGKGVLISMFLKKTLSWHTWERLFLKRLT